MFYNKKILGLLVNLSNMSSLNKLMQSVLALSIFIFKISILSFSNFFDTFGGCSNRLNQIVPPIVIGPNSQINLVLNAPYRGTDLLINVVVAVYLSVIVVQAAGPRVGTTVLRGGPQEVVGANIVERASGAEVATRKGSESAAVGSLSMTTFWATSIESLPDFIAQLSGHWVNPFVDITIIKENNKLIFFIVIFI